jgi:hypothetical protein
MTHWGHLIFGAPGERARGVPVTRREVDLVYHDLGSRVLEVPVDDGFVVFSAAGGEQRVSFPSLLTPLAEAAEAAGSAATEAVDTLPPGNPQRQRLDGRLDDLVAELARLRQSLDRGDLTLGLCDRLAQGLRRSHESLESLTWTARIVRLAATP